MVGSMRAGSTPAGTRRLAIVTTHPIQYNAPLFKLLAGRGNLDVKVFYTWGQATGKLYDHGFGKEREWDIPLLEGYEYRFLENKATDPGVHHFSGISNPSIVEEIRQFDPQAILVYGWSFASHLKVLRYFHGKKTILFRGDSTLIDESMQARVRRMARRLFLRWVYRHVDKALYVGTRNREYFSTHGLTPDQMDWAPHAIDNQRFGDGEGRMQEEAARWRAELGIPLGETVFLFAGKLEPKKDPLKLIHSFRELGEERAWLVIVGNGVLEDTCRAASAGNSRILFLDFQNQLRMPVVYRLADVFVLPSQGPGETWGLAVNEAMACGRAVIVSDRCGCAADLVSEGKNGFIFASGNEGAASLELRAASEEPVERLSSMKGGVSLVTAMRYFVEHPGAAREMGEVSGKMIVKWSFGEIAQAIEKEMRK